jgi:hypothetical protein
VLSLVLCCNSDLILTACNFLEGISVSAEQCIRTQQSTNFSSSTSTSNQPNDLAKSGKATSSRKHRQQPLEYTGAFSRNSKKLEESLQAREKIEKNANSASTDQYGLKRLLFCILHHPMDAKPHNIAPRKKEERLQTGGSNNK